MPSRGELRPDGALPVNAKPLGDPLVQASKDYENNLDDIERKSLKYASLSDWLNKIFGVSSDALRKTCDAIDEAIKGYDLDAFYSECAKHMEFDSVGEMKEWCESLSKEERQAAYDKIMEVMEELIYETFCREKLPEVLGAALTGNTTSKEVDWQSQEAQQVIKELLRRMIRIVRRIEVAPPHPEKILDQNNF